MLLPVRVNDGCPCAVPNVPQNHVPHEIGFAYATFTKKGGVPGAAFWNDNDILIVVFAEGKASYGKGVHEASRAIYMSTQISEYLRTHYNKSMS